MARMKFFEQHPGEHVPKRIQGGVLTIVIVAALLFYAYTGGKIPFIPQGGHDVKAVFTSGIDLAPGRTPIRVHGVNVGLVKSVKRTADGKDVVVTMHISNNSVHVKSDAHANIYWRTLLGFQYYIQLDPGVSSTPLGNGTIPLKHTSVQVEADQVLETLTPNSRAGTQQFFQQISRAFAPGNAAGQTIDELAPAANNVGPTLNSLQGTHPGDLSNTVSQASRLVTGLVASQKQLGDLVDTGNTTFQATAAQQGSIDTMLQQGPETLQQTQTTLTKLYATLGKLDPVTEDLQPGSRALRPAETKLNPALRQLRPFLDTARPTLVALRPALQRLSHAATIGTPLLKHLEPTFNTLNQKTLPGLSVTGASGLKTFETIGPTVSSVEDSAEQYDVNGHVQRFEAAAGGANTVSFLPCSIPDLSTLKLNCSDLTSVFSAILGGGTSKPTITSAADARKGGNG